MDIVERITKFLDERAKVRGLDQERIASLHVGDEREAILRTSDLRRLLDIIEHKYGTDDCDGCSDRDDEIARLRDELERERMRLAACGVVALANTPASAKEARQMHEDYWSASVADVARMVDEQMRLRDENANLQADAEECDALRTKLADILTRTANALKGEPGELQAHSWHDLPERAQRARDESATLQAEMERAAIACSHQEAQMARDILIAAMQKGE